MTRPLMASVAMMRFYALVVIAEFVGVLPTYNAPVEIAAIIHSYHASTSVASVIVSAELLASALAALLTASIVRDDRATSLALIPCAIGVLINFLSVFNWPVAGFVALRIVGGASCGVLYGLGCFWSARDQRGVAAFAAGLAVSGTVMAFAVGYLLQSVYSRGFAGLYGPVATFQLVSLLLLVGVLRRSPELRPLNAAAQADSDSRRNGLWTSAFILICAGTMAGGLQLIWSLCERLASVRGYETGTIGTILSVSLGFMVLGSIAAVVVGTRYSVPLMCGLGLLVAAGATWVVGFSTTPLMFGFGLCACYFSSVFSMPMMIGTAGLRDATGRLATLAGGVCLVAGAIAPVFGGFAFDLLSPVAVTWIVLAIFIVGGTTAVALVRPLRSAPAVPFA